MDVNEETCWFRAATLLKAYEELQRVDFAGNYLRGHKLYGFQIPISRNKLIYRRGKRLVVHLLLHTVPPVQVPSNLLAGRVCGNRREERECRAAH